MLASWLPIVAPLAVLAGLGVHLGRRARRAAEVRAAAAAWAQTAGTVLSTTIQIRRVGQSRSEIPVVIYTLSGGRPPVSVVPRACRRRDRPHPDHR